MNSKRMPDAAEILCSFKTVEPEPLSPFVWVLLKALNTFSHGMRPSCEDLCEKLAVGEPSFLSEAWSELCDLQLSDHDDFYTAVMTEKGREAFERGFIKVNEPMEHKKKLYFRLDNGEIIKWKDEFEPKHHKSLYRPPNWADKVTEKLVREALAEQYTGQEERIDDSDLLYDLKIYWELSSCVKLN